MKNDRRTYKTQHSSSGGLPLARGDTDSESNAQWICHCDPDAVGRSNLTGCRGISPPRGRPPTGFSELDVGERPNNSVTLNLFQGLKNRCRTEFGMTDRLCGEPPEVECDIGLMMDSIKSETTCRTNDEIHNGRYLTMEEVLHKQKKPSSIVMWCREKSKTQQAIAFECSASAQESDVSVHSHRLRFSIGGAYLQILEYDSTAARDSAGSILNRRIGNWSSGIRWRDVGWQDTWDSVMVESVRLVLQRWRGVCSFSQTMRSTRSDEESHVVHGLRSKKQCRPWRMIMLRSYSWDYI